MIVMFVEMLSLYSML